MASSSLPDGTRPFAVEVLWCQNDSERVKSGGEIGLILPTFPYGSLFERRLIALHVSLEFLLFVKISQRISFRVSNCVDFISLYFCVHQRDSISEDNICSAWRLVRISDVIIAIQVWESVYNPFLSPGNMFVWNSIKAWQPESLNKASSGSAGL